MTEFKTGDKVRVVGSPYKRGVNGTVVVVAENDGSTSYPISATFDRVLYRFAVSELELIEPARPTAKEEIENVKAQVKAILSAAQDGGGVPLAEARAKGIIEGLDVALAFIYEESLSEEDRQAMDAIDGGAEPW